MKNLDSGFAELIAATTDEEQLFALGAEIERDPALDGGTREQLLERVREGVDRRRAARGLSEESSLEELAAAWTGTPPVPHEAVWDDPPPSVSIAAVSAGICLEFIAGRMR